MEYGKRIVLLAVAIAVVAIIWRLSTLPVKVIISVKETSKTPSVYIDIYKVSTGELILKGKTSSLGVFKSTIQVEENEKLRIKFHKSEYVVNPSEVLRKPTGKPPAIFVTIKAVPVGKEIIFKVKNSVPNVTVMGINESGKRTTLGQTDQNGLLKAKITKRHFKEIYFHYSLDGTTVFSDVKRKYSYDLIPRTINLHVIPDDDLSFYFHCEDEISGLELRDVLIEAEGISEKGITDNQGYAIIQLQPSEERGPSIGDTLEWIIEKDNFVIIKKHRTILMPGVYSYPEKDTEIPYIFTLARAYKLIINILEDNTPVPYADVLVNGILYRLSNDLGRVTYVYYDENIGEQLDLDVNVEGFTASPQSITLGKIDRTLTFHVRTIHAFFKFIDSVTGENIDGLTVIRDGKEIGKSSGLDRIKLIFPHTGLHELKITDKSKDYLEKTYPLNIQQNVIGDEFIVEIDPKTGVSFTVIDRSKGGLLEKISVARDGDKIGKTNKDGEYIEDYNPDPGNYYTYSFFADNYLPIEKQIFRIPGRHKEQIELEQLVAKVTVKDELGNPAAGVEVLVGDSVIDKTNSHGELNFSPKRVGETYSLKFISPSEDYETIQHDFYYGTQDQNVVFTVNRQPWIELQIFQPTEFGDKPIPGMNVSSSTGQAGQSDSNGLFHYKVIEKSNPIHFEFLKPCYEKISKKIISKGVKTTVRVPVPRLEAYFYIYDSRTNQPVENLQVSVNGELKTATNYNGKANILPDVKPSKLSLYIQAQNNSYYPLTKTVQYNNSNLGQFEIDPRPIEINVNLHWSSSGLPVMGIIEIDLPYQRYELTKKDGGEHTFNYYKRTLNPKLTIKTTTPSGQTFTREHPIVIPPDNSIYSVDVPLIIEPKPRISILVDEGVTIEVLHHRIDSILTVFSGHDGDYYGDLPDFGGYTVIRTGIGFVIPDEQFIDISSSEQLINLRRQPHCKKAQEYYNNGNWPSFVQNVLQLTVNDNCYCEMNKKAAEVSMDKLNNFADALSFYEKIIYGSYQCSIGKDNPRIDPYIYLRMLECCVELKLYENGLRDADNFDGLVQLLGANKKQSICKKDYLLGQLMVNEYWRMENDIRTIVNHSELQKIRNQQNELKRKTINHLDRYEKNKGSCPSLAIQRNQLN